MKGIKLFLIFLCLQLLASQSTFAQIVEYSFHNRDTIIGTLPFDRPFIIKFTHIDTAKINSIVVRVYESGVTNYRKLLKTAGYRPSRSSSRTTQIVVGNNDILKSGSTLVIKPDSIVKYVDFADSTAFMKSMITLKPSTGYFIEVSAHEYIPLSTAEKTLLSRKIAANADIRKLINDFAKENIKDPDRNFDDYISQLNNQLNDKVAAVVTQANPTYNFHPPKLDQLLAQLFVNIANASLAKKVVLESIEGSDSTKRLVPVYKLEVDTTLTKKLEEIDWYLIKKDDDINKKLKELVESRKKMFEKSPLKFGIDRELSNLLNEVDKGIAQKQRILDTLINQIWVNSVDKGSAFANTFPKEFQKQAQEFIRSDLGLAYIWGIDRVNPYVAAQISLSPLDDSIPLREYKGLGNKLRSRFSFMIGISVDGIAKDSVRKGLIGNQALILGSGLKLWQWLKVNSGFYLYYSQPRNPLRDPGSRSFKGSPFISLSIDIRVQALLNGIGSSIFKNQTP